MFKLSTKGRYGTRALLDIALHQQQGPVKLNDTANRQAISARYLEHLMVQLAANGFVRSIRGRSGGFMLARSPSDTPLSEVLEVLEGPASVVECTKDPTVCERAPTCVARDVWSDLSGIMHDYLHRITLEDLCNRHLEKQKSGKEMYYI
jgi:Rrf2 family protein